MTADVSAVIAADPTATTMEMISDVVTGVGASSAA
jgi:hypothetical protein